jgi:hypothetical protein
MIGFITIETDPKKSPETFVHEGGDGHAGRNNMLL